MKIPTRKILWFIYKNPNCSSFDIANKFKMEHDFMYRCLKDIVEYFHFRSTYIDMDYPNKGMCFVDIRLNGLGQTYIDDFKTQRFRFVLPLVISIIALVIAGISLFIDISELPIQ